MKQTKINNQRTERRQRRTRSKISGTAEMPRLAVSRSNKGMFLQVIDDLKGHTLVSASSKEIKNKGAKTAISTALGTLLAEKCKKAGVEKMVFDRRDYKYHGRVKAVADAIREAGIKI